MTRPRRLAGWLIGGWALYAAQACGAEPISQPATPPTKVVLILLDRLDLPDLLKADTPSLRKLMQRGAVGVISPKMSGEICSANALATLLAGTPTEANGNLLDRPVFRIKRSSFMDLSALGLDDAAPIIPVTISAAGFASLQLHTSSRWIEHMPSAVSEQRLRKRIAILEAYAASAQPSETTYLFAVLTSRAPKRYFPRLTPIILVGPGVEPGLLTTPSTRQRGLVTLSDIAPTILRMLELPVPTEMTGRAMTVVSSRDPIAEIRKLDHWTKHRDAVAEPAVVLIAAVPGIVTIGAVLVLLLAPAPTSQLPRRGEDRAVGQAARPTTLIRHALLASLALPLAALVVSPFVAVGPGMVYCGLIMVAAMQTGIAVAVARKPTPALAVLCFAMAGVITIDALQGGPWTTWSIMGNSFTTGGRYYGVENGHVAYLIAYTLMLLGLMPTLRWLGLAVAIVLPLLIGLRWFGANFGGTIATAAALWTFVIVSARGRFTARETVLVVVATLAQTALVVACDLLFKEAGQSHIGLAFSHPSTLVETALRKWRANLGYFAVTPFNYATVAIAVALTSLVFRRPPRVQRMFDRWPGLPAAVTAGAVGIWAALVTNDSGIVMLDQMLQVLVPALLLLVETRQPA